MRAISDPRRHAPFGAPVLFQNKHEASLRLCIDYRAHNNTQKKKEPVPLIADLFDQLGAGRYFTKLDLRSGGKGQLVVDRLSLSPRGKVDYD